MIEEGFIIGDSVIHRLDPRIKIIVAGVYSIVVATSNRYMALIPGLSLALLLILFSKIPIRAVCKRLLPVNGFILILWFFLPFSVKGEPILTLGPLIASKEGVLYSALITIKSNTIILALMALIATTSIFTLGRALGYLRVPSKIVHLLLFSYRYIHVIHLESHRLIQAIRIRGFQPGNNIHTYRTYAYLIGMVLVKSHDRAERVRAAMLCRGFKGRFYDLREFSLKTSDLVVMTIMLMAIAGVGWLQWGIMFQSTKLLQ